MRRTSGMLNRPGSMFAWAALISGASRSDFASQLLNLTGFANHRQRKRVLVRLVDLGLQIHGHLQQIGAFAGNLLLVRCFGGDGRLRFRRLRFLLCRGRRARCVPGWIEGRQRERCLRMAAHHTHTHRNGQRGATRQRAEQPAAASKPDLGPSWTSAMPLPAWYRPHHGN